MLHCPEYHGHWSFQIPAGSAPGKKHTTCTSNEIMTFQAAPVTVGSELKAKAPGNGVLQLRGGKELSDAI